MKKALRTESYKTYTDKKQKRDELFKNFKVFMDHCIDNGVIQWCPTTLQNAYGTIAGYIFNYYKNPKINSAFFDTIVDKIKVLSSELELARPKINRREYYSNNNSLLFIAKTLEQIDNYLESDDNWDTYLDVVTLALLAEELERNPVIRRYMSKDEIKKRVIQIEKLLASDFTRIGQTMPEHSIDQVLKYNDRYANALMNLEQDPVVVKAIQSAKSYIH